MNDVHIRMKFMLNESAHGGLLLVIVVIIVVMHSKGPERAPSNLAPSFILIASGRTR